MRHVGDMHLQLEISVGQSPHRHRVIEIARRLAIDGDNRQRPVIVAVRQFAGRNGPLKLLRLLQHFDRETGAADGACE